MALDFVGEQEPSERIKHNSPSNNLEEQKGENIAI